jgi:hypothetical protein
VTDQGDLALLEDPVAQELLVSRIPAHLAYTWTDGTARVVPIWFNWSGGNVVMGSPAGAPKLKALAMNPSVAVTIDSHSWPAHVLMLRGNAHVDMKNDVDEDYAAAAERYMGEQAGREWVATLRGRPMARIAVQPEWVGILDFETRFPSALTM